VEERNLKSMMSSAFGDTDYEYSKNFEIRETFMRETDGEDEESKDGPIKRRRERLGNDLDELDIGPEFQV